MLGPWISSWQRALSAFASSWTRYPMRTLQTSYGNCVQGQGDSGSSSSTHGTRLTPTPALSLFLPTWSMSGDFGTFLSLNPPSSSPSPGKCLYHGVSLPFAYGPRDSTLTRESTGKANSGETRWPWCACPPADSRVDVNSSKPTFPDGSKSRLKSPKAASSTPTGPLLKPSRVGRTRSGVRPLASTSGTSSPTSRTRTGSTRRSRPLSKRAPRRSL